MESIVTAVTYNRPEEPLKFMEECIKTLRTRQFKPKEDRSTIKWNIFLKPFISCADSQFAIKPMGIQRRSFKKDMDVLPAIELKSSTEPPLLPAMNLKSSLDALPPIETPENMQPYKVLQSESLPKYPPKTNAWGNIIFVLGGPCSGKTTQCILIAKQYNYAHISASELLRDECIKQAAEPTEMMKVTTHLL
jgi:hypothetical protein